MDLAVDQRADYIVAARLQRQWRNVYRNWHEGPAWSDARRATNVEVGTDLEWLVTGRRRHLHRLSIGVDDKELELVPPVRFLPGHFDDRGDGEEARVRADLGPAEAERKELPGLDFRVVG